MRQLRLLMRDWGEFLRFVKNYFYLRLERVFRRFEAGKSVLVEGLYQKRGKYVRPFIHAGMVSLVFVAVSLGPVVLANTFPDEPPLSGVSAVLGTSTQMLAETQISDKPPAEVREYQVAEGDTLGSIAEKFGVSLETILWANNMTEKSKIKPGQTLKVPPVTGLVHQVKRGETIYSIAKKYDVEAQNIVNWPYNSFADDETFALAVGQILVVPDGVMPEAPPLTGRFIARQTPDAGTVSATGQFIWPTSGRVTQQPVWYHMALDIANKAGPDVLAADSGTVTLAGAPDRGGYGIRVMIDHGNGFQTLYAHLQQVYVAAGQTVGRGAAIGRMGSTGRSTGTHLHFEVRKDGALQNPWNYLQ